MNFERLPMYALLLLEPLESHTGVSTKFHSDNCLMTLWQLPNNCCIAVTWQILMIYMKNVQDFNYRQAYKAASSFTQPKNKYNIMQYVWAQYSVIHNSIAPNKELCSKIVLGEVGVWLPWWCHALVLPPPGNWGLFFKSHNFFIMEKWPVFSAF